MQKCVWGLCGKEKNTPVERPEPSVALMVNCTIIAPLLVGDGPLLVAPALPELFNEVIPIVPVEKELSDPVGVRLVVGLVFRLVEFEMLVDNSEVADGDPAELESVEWDGNGVNGAGLDGNEFEGVGFRVAELTSPLESE